MTFSAGRYVVLIVFLVRGFCSAALAQSDAQAQYNLGVAYHDGEGVPRDYSEAVRLYRQAAAQGYAPAQNKLGVAYRNGEGVPRDYAEAVSWFRKAAGQGNADALCSLGIMRLNGEGIARNSVLAYMLFNIAAGKGRADATKRREQISHILTPEQLTEAQSLSISWKAGSPLPETTSP